MPLFPLQAVLFPGSRLPLHIFEERYKVLVSQCIREETEFGVILANGGELAEVGCTAGIVSVLKVYNDGRMDIAVEGRQRFRVHRFDPAQTPYLVGEVEFFDGGPASANAIAHTDCEILSIPHGEMESLMRTRPDLATKFLWAFARTLAGRLRETDQKVSTLFAISRVF